MGERANYAIVDADGLRLYASRVGALTLLDDLARHQIDTSTPVTQWYDDVWCEGAVVVDQTNQTLLLFTWHHDGVEDRAQKLAAIAKAWPGWRLRWAYEGIEQIVEHVGGDRREVRTDHDRTEGSWGPCDEFPEEVNFLLTIDEHEHWLHHELNEPVWAGPALLDVRVTRQRGRHADSGLHLDTRNRTAGFWTTVAIRGSLADLAARWPGWTFEFWEDRHAEQRDRVRLPG